MEQIEPNNNPIAAQRFDNSTQSHKAEPNA